jgi:hypothetical protein
MKQFELKSLLDTVGKDVEFYAKAVLKYDHYIEKQKEYGVQISAADLEIRDRVFKVVKILRELENQLHESTKGQ